MRERWNVAIVVLVLVATLGVLTPGASGGVPLPAEPPVVEPVPGARTAMGTATGEASGDEVVVASSGLAGSGITTLVEAAPGTVEVLWEVRGTGSSIQQIVQAVVEDPATGVRETSAPIPLAPYRQRVGVTAKASGGPLTLSLVESGNGWAAGDGYAARLVAVRAAAVTTTSTSGRQFLVHGSPYTIKGYNYHAGPIGTPIGFSGTNTVGWQANPTHCQTDADLMARAGINTLRIHFRDVYEGNTKQCLDAFAANGVGLLWLVNGPGSWQAGEDEYLEAFWLTLSNTVKAVKDHPATLGYVIGNENVAHDPALYPEWFRNLDELARRTKELDPLHVTTTAITGRQFDYVSTGTAPNLDMWGTNRYSSATGYPSTLWNQIASRTTKPVWFPEWGTDRYRCPQHEPGFGLQIVLDPFACPLPASGQHDQVQADWNALAWDQIAANLNESDPAKVMVGGTIFYWSDWWSFACCLFNQAGSDWTHEVASRRDANFQRIMPDGAFNLEWAGSTHALHLHQTGPRVTTVTYDRMAEKFLGSPAHSMTAPAVSSVGACGATLSWTTGVPTSYRIDHSTEKNVIVAGSIVQDNYVADKVQASATLATSHTVRLTGLGRGQANRIYVRSYDTSGRIVSAPPVTVTTPLDGPGGECTLP